MRKVWGRLSSRERMLSISTTSSAAPASVADVTGLRILHEGSSPVVDIVFIHGLTGDRISTWTHARTGVFWPTDFLAVDIPNARIMTFGYDSDIVGLWDPASMNRISNHSRDLLGALSHRRHDHDTAQRKIIFVCHSLGGLVVEETLNLSRGDAEEHIRQIGDCTVAIAFIGTPHHGSDLAAWAMLGTRLVNLFRKANTDIVAVLRPGSEMLARIQNQFQNSQRVAPIAITCFYEDLPYPNIGLIVPQHSAILPAYAHYSIHANHQEMTKFATRESNGYATILGELRRWVGHYIAPAVVDSDDPAPAAPAPHQALLAAAAFGGPETLELCLRATPDVNIVEPGPTQRNALHLAAAFNQYRNIVPLLRAGVNLHATTDQGFTPLFVACIVGSTEVVRVLLEEGQDNPNAKDRHGNTPLHVAAVNGRVNIARILLEHGADPFIAQDGWKPLDVALTKRCTELVEILTEAMSNPENRPDGVLRAGGR